VKRNFMKLEAKNIKKVYANKSGKSVVALKDVNITLKEGEFVCIVGPSGCGKTTLLRIIAGLERATNGSIFINGRSSSTPSSEKGMVFQEFTLFPWMNIRRNVEFGLKYVGVPKEKRKEIADKYIRLVDLVGWEKRYPFELSGGMKQRVAIARALATDPEILLMDEPFGSLDVRSRHVLQDNILEVWRKTHKTILFVSHDIEEAVYLGNKIYVFTARPGTIKSIHEVQLPYPRNRTSIDFLALRAKIQEDIEQQIT